MDIPLRDHIIIGDHERYYSFEEHIVFEYKENAVDDVIGAGAVRELSTADKAEWAAARQQAIRDITEKLEQGVKNLFDSEKFKEYLNTMSKFHNYSPEQYDPHCYAEILNKECCDPDLAFICLHISVLQYTLKRH